MKTLLIFFTLTASFFSYSQISNLQDTWQSIIVLRSMNSTKIISLQEELDKLSETVKERGNQVKDVKLLEQLTDLTDRTNNLLTQTEEIRNHIITKSGGLTEHDTPMVLSKKKQKAIYFTNDSDEKKSISNQISLFTQSYNSSVAEVNQLNINYKSDNSSIQLTSSDFIITNLKIGIIQTNSLDKALRLLRTTNAYLTSSQAKFDEIFVGFDSNTKTIIEGDTLKGKIELTATSSLIEQYLYVDDVKFESNTYQTIASTKGCNLISKNLYECELKAEIEVIRKDNPKVKIPSTFKYYVLKK